MTKLSKNAADFESAKMNYTGTMDLECVALCDAMNRFDGIQTYESCCGHGKDAFCIWFSADSLEVLPPVLYWFDACHGGANWSVHVTTDCAYSPATFRAESSAWGDFAYEEAGDIAKHMNEDNDVSR